MGTFITNIGYFAVLIATPIALLIFIAKKAKGRQPVGLRPPTDTK